MATRFYIQNFTPDVTPSDSGTWTDISNVVNKTMKIYRQASANTTHTFNVNNSSSTASTLFFRSVSWKLASQTISGTFKGQIQSKLSSATGCTAVTRVVVTVIDSAGTVKATLINGANGDLALTTTSTNRKTPPSGTSISSYTCSDGDRIVIECGIIRTAGTTSRTGSLVVGDPLTVDLAEDNTTTTANNAWFEFSATLSWMTGENHFVDPEDFSNAYWSKNACSVSSIASPNPQILSAWKLVEDATTANHRLRKEIPTFSGERRTLSIYAKAVERTWLRLNINDSTNTAYGAVQFTGYYDLSNGSLGSLSGTGGSYAIEDVSVLLGSGWYRCSLTTAIAIADGLPFHFIHSSTGDGVGSYAGDGTSGIYICGAMLNLGASPSAYVVSSFLPRMMLMGVG